MRIRAKHQDVWLVRPGDYVGVVFAHNLNDEQLDRYGRTMKEAWPDVRVVFFEGDIELKVLRPETAP